MNRPSRFSCSSSLPPASAAIAASTPPGPGTARVVTGWYDAGLVEGNMNKLVPSVSLKLRNKSDEPVRSIQINAMFRRVGEPRCGASTTGGPSSASRWRRADKPRNSCCDRGSAIPGEQPRMQMLQNSEFVDAKVEIFLRQGSRVWAKLAEFPIQRQLLTQ